MHIPDGYLSLQTTLPALGGMVPMWAVALNKVKKVLKAKQIPLLSLCAAFSFLIMMFNVPLGASSAHAVGAVFIAILLGPFASCIAVSSALLIQALVFGDGGIISYGINCLNMAVIMPFVGYYLYKAIAGKSEITSRRSLIGIFTGSYVGLNVAAFFAAVEFGIQPLLFTAANGTPLYGFYPLSVSIPAMMSAHLLFAGPIEGIVTVGAICYIRKFAPHLIGSMPEIVEPQEKKESIFKRYKSLIIGLAVMAVLTPIGLIATGTAWGEWGTDEIIEQLGYIPAGFAQLSDIWKSIFPDYSVPGLEGNFFSTSVGYIISAVVGALLIAGLILLTSKLINRSQKGKK